MFVIDPNSDDLSFPSVKNAARDGMIAIGGDLRPERLLTAYRNGIFPWYNEGQPILWWSPEPRAVLFPAKIKISRSLRKALRSDKFQVTFDRCFSDVMRACAGPRGKEMNNGTWITDEMHDAYVKLHELGHAHSVETWHNGRLVGGLYGVAIGGIFFGESMFSHETDASKVALVHIARQIDRWGYAVIDCQMPTPHLASLGADTISRARYLQLLNQVLTLPGRRENWIFDSDLSFD